MTMRFYLAWGAAVALALVLPVAIPYAIWPPREGVHDDMVAECGRRAENDAIRGGSPVQSLWPLSNDVRLCSRDDAGVLIYTADITAHGPYGVAFASATVSSRDINWHYKDRGALFSLAALLLGAIAASIPFAMVPLRNVIGRNPAPAL